MRVNVHIQPLTHTHGHTSPSHRAPHHRIPLLLSTRIAVFIGSAVVAATAAAAAAAVDVLLMVNANYTTSNNCECTTKYIHQVHAHYNYDTSERNGVS